MENPSIIFSTAAAAPGLSLRLANLSADSPAEYEFQEFDGKDWATLDGAILDPGESLVVTLFPAGAVVRLLGDLNVTAEMADAPPKPAPEVIAPIDYAKLDAPTGDAVKSLEERIAALEPANK